MALRAFNSKYTLSGIIDFEIWGKNENGGIGNQRNSRGVLLNNGTINLYNRSESNGRGILLYDSIFEIAEGGTVNIRGSGVQNSTAIELNTGKLNIFGNANLLSSGKYGGGIVNNDWGGVGGSTVTIGSLATVNIQVFNDGYALGNRASQYNPGTGIVPNIMNFTAGSEISTKVEYSGSQGIWKIQKNLQIPDGKGNVDSMDGFTGVSKISTSGRDVTVKLSR